MGFDQLKVAALPHLSCRTLGRAPCMSKRCLFLVNLWGSYRFELLTQHVLAYLHSVMSPLLKVAYFVIGKH